MHAPNASSSPLRPSSPWCSPSSPWCSPSSQWCSMMLLDSPFCFTNQIPLPPHTYCHSHSHSHSHPSLTAILPHRRNPPRSGPRTTALLCVIRPRPVPSRVPPHLPSHHHPTNLPITLQVSPTSSPLGVALSFWAIPQVAFALIIIIAVIAALLIRLGALSFSYLTTPTRTIAAPYNTVQDSNTTSPPHPWYHS